jgi:hypothetical protein
MNLPGTWLLALSARLLDQEVIESAVVPTLADLQYEALGAGGNAWRRWLALARGYCAIVRLLFRHGLIWRSPMRRLITVLVLGGVGSALLVEILSVSSPGPAGFGAFFLMAVLTPVVLRLLNAGSSYRQMFGNCMGVGMMMATVFFGWIALVDHPSRLPWHAYLLAYLFLTCVALGSALAAAAAWKPAAGGEAVYRRRMLHVVAGAATFTACYSVVGLWVGYARGPYGVPNTMSFAAFLGLFFAAVSVAVYLPVLLGARRLIGGLRARPLLAILGAVLFPIPLLAFPLLQGRLGSTWLFLLHNPGTLLRVSLPYVLAGAVLGWLLAEPRAAPLGRVAASDPL